VDDFDLLGEEYRADPARLWSEMRESCPVAHSSRHGGGWMLSRYEDIVKVALDTETFSSRAGEVTGPIPRPGRELRMPPETTDPPDHAMHRRLMTPFFTKEAVARMELLTRATAKSLLDEIAAAAGPVDVVERYAGQIPLKITSAMLGVPDADGPRFQSLLIDMLKSGAEDFQLRADAIRTIKGYFRDLLQSYRNQPGETGLFSHLLVEQDRDERITDDIIIGMAFLMLVGGIDTVWNVMSSSLCHLATHPADRKFLIDHPEATESAVEELLRAYAPVTIGRLVVKDTELAGRRIPAGDRIIIAWGAANYDPSVHENPDTVCLASAQERHLSFGYGIHRCLGAPLALMELRVGLTEWLARFPDFELTEPAIEWTGGSTRGPKFAWIRPLAG
jgi:cytochrome P450